jgi:hypothetical protein
VELRGFGTRPAFNIFSTNSVGFRTFTPTKLNGTGGRSAPNFLSFDCAFVLSQPFTLVLGLWSTEFSGAPRHYPDREGVF